jgi:hypothetical protein
LPHLSPASQRFPILNYALEFAYWCNRVDVPAVREVLRRKVGVPRSGPGRRADFEPQWAAMKKGMAEALPHLYPPPGAAVDGNVRRLALSPPGPQPWQVSLWPRVLPRTSMQPPKLQQHQQQRQQSSYQQVAGGGGGVGDAAANGGAGGSSTGLSNGPPAADVTSRSRNNVLQWLPDVIERECVRVFGEEFLTGDRTSASRCFYVTTYQVRTGVMQIGHDTGLIVCSMTPAFRHARCLGEVLG